MDTQTIDQAYQQLQSEFEDVAKTVQALAEKLRAAEQAGDTNAHEWLLDLKQIAMDVKDEQTQANLLLQGIHAYISEAAAQTQAQAGQQPQARSFGAMGGSPFGGFLGGGFGRAMEMGAGIGLGEDLINSIFR